MNRFLFAAATFLVAGLTISTVTLAMADDPPPVRPAVQPKAVQVRPVQIQPVQPAQPGLGRVTPARMATLEEEFESLEAHRDVKKAIVKAAEVAVKATEANLEIVAKANAPQVEMIKSKMDVEAAKAQLEIRMAELKEVEVKIKHAKKRLEDAKAGGVRILPVPKADRKAVDPPPPAAFAISAEQADPKAVEALKKKLAELEAVIADKKAAVVKAEAVMKDAKAELDRVLDIAKRGRVRPGTIEAAEAKVKEAREKAEQAVAEVQKAQNEAAKVQAKLKEIEK